MIAWIFTDLEGDKSLYLLFAQSILDGHPPLEPTGAINGVPTYGYNQAVYSPLYTYLALPFLWATKSFTATSFCLDVFSWTVFLSGMFRMSLLLSHQRSIANLLVLCAGFFLYPHELESPPKDTLAIGLMMWNVYFFCQFVKHGPVTRYSILLVAGIISLSMIKFLYLPVALLFAIMPVFYALYKWSKTHLLHALSILAACLVYAFLFQYWIGHLRSFKSPFQLTAQVNEFVSGFYPENLLKTFPFISASLINTNFWGVQLQDIFKLEPASITMLFQMIDLLLLVGLVLLVRRIMRREPVVLRSGVMVACLILGMLFYMSARYESLDYQGLSSTWTYVQDARSFLFLIVFIQTILFNFIFKGNTLFLSLRNFLLLMFLIECLHGGYFTMKQVMASNRLKQEKSKGSPVKRITTLVLQAKEESGNTVTISTPDHHLRRYAFLQGITVNQFQGTACLPGQPPYPVLFAVYESDSSILQCSEGRQLASDQIRPFILQFYEGSNKK